MRYLTGFGWLASTNASVVNVILICSQVFWASYLIKVVEALWSSLYHSHCEMLALGFDQSLESILQLAAMDHIRVSWGAKTEKIGSTNYRSRFLSYVGPVKFCDPVGPKQFLPFRLYNFIPLGGGRTPLPGGGGASPRPRSATVYFTYHINKSRRYQYITWYQCDFSRPFMTNLLIPLIEMLTFLF